MFCIDLKTFSYCSVLSCLTNRSLGVLFPIAEGFQASSTSSVKTNLLLLPSGTHFVSPSVPLSGAASWSVGPGAGDSWYWSQAPHLSVRGAPSTRPSAAVQPLCLPAAARLASLGLTQCSCLQVGELPKSGPGRCSRSLPPPLRLQASLILCWRLQLKPKCEGMP